MSAEAERNIVVLDAGLFGDRQTINRALQCMKSSNIDTVEIVPEQMDERAWANVLEKIMSADMLLAL